MARARMEAEKQAEGIVQSLSHASEAAIETTLAQIKEKLSKKVQLMYHIWASVETECAACQHCSSGDTDAVHGSIIRQRIMIGIVGTSKDPDRGKVNENDDSNDNDNRDDYY